MRCLICNSPDGQITHEPTGGTDYWQCFSCGNKHRPVLSNQDQMLSDLGKIFSRASTTITEHPVYFVPDGRVERHYDMTIQPIDYIVANDLDFLHGNVVKYVSRWQGKDGVRDLDKALDYLNRIKKLAMEGYYGDEYKQ